ncbi:MAG TPA: pitrilysin family protein, partial [Chthonomonadaceae bacterium]|nr:pitrilysin family protein [Chthonomonadaceae bacterium]
SPVTALLVSVKAGYFNEPDPVGGIAHVIEHMIFKGTPERPDGEQFAREIRELGGTLNAATYYEETYYYVVVPSANHEQAFAVQADALQNALYDAGELSKEIEVIVQESQQKRDNPLAMLMESLYELAFDSHRIRRWRIGHPEPLRSLRHEDLASFVRDHYRPENMVVAIVGDVDTERAKRLIERVWGGVPRGELCRELSPAEPPRDSFRYRRATGDHKQRLLMFHLPAPPALHPDAAPLLVLSAILSDGRSARLYRRLKEELQIANSASASYETFEQMGLFKIGAECVGDDPLAVEAAIWMEIRRVQTDGVTEEELRRVKTRIESSRLYAQEEVFGMARTLVSYELLGGYRLADTVTERIRAVTAADVRRVARSYLQLGVASLMEFLPGGSNAPERTAEEVRAAIEERVRTAAGGPAEACGASGTGEFQNEALTADERPEVLEVVPRQPFEEAPAAAADRFSLPVTEMSLAAPSEATPYAGECPDSAGPSGRIHAARAQTGEARRIVLPNGLTLVFKPRRDLPIVSVQALFRGGKAMESRETCGLTGLMLRSSVKGARGLSAEQIANRIESLGSGIGFSPGPDHFGYGFKVRRDNLAEAFALFAEVVAHPSFPPEEVEREKQAVFGEIRRQQDSSMSVAYEQFAAAYFGDHPYGLPTIGIEGAVAALGAGDLRRWHERLVSPGNLVASIVGDIEEPAAIALFELLFPTARALASNQEPAAGY